MASKSRPLVGYLARHFSQQSGVPPSKPAAQSSASADVNVNVPGLTAAVVRKPSGDVGPGVNPAKTGAYKVPEYFCYNNMSYYEAEIEMANHRLPQPSSLQ